MEPSNALARSLEILRPIYYPPCQNHSTTLVSLRDYNKYYSALQFQNSTIQPRQCSGLRSLPFPENQPLGGVQGEGCKDMRRHIRVSSEPIMTPKEFEDFLFSKPHFGSPIFIDSLRKFSPSDQTVPSCVFTHGDFRPPNIHVEQNEDGGWRIVGIIDRESSGFYPAYWESLKITNNLTTLEPSDWYKYLPECVAPHQYPTRWLMDRVWDEHIYTSGIYCVIV